MADDHAFDAFYEFNEDCFYRKAKVNDDGSITYWMTESQHLLFMLIII